MLLCRNWIDIFFKTFAGRQKSCLKVSCDLLCFFLYRLEKSFINYVGRQVVHYTMVGTIKINTGTFLSILRRYRVMSVTTNACLFLQEDIKQIMCLVRPKENTINLWHSKIALRINFQKGRWRQEGHLEEGVPKPDNLYHDDRKPDQQCLGCDTHW